MDKEKSRDVMRGRSSGSCFSPTKRQQMRRSSAIVINGNSNNGGDGEKNATMRWKKEKVRGSRWRSSNHKAVAEAGVGRGTEGEEGDAFHSPPITSSTNSPTSRKRVRIHGKISEDCDSVDPAPVPRKLRSAIYKQTSKSASPPLPDGKKKHQFSFDGMQEPSSNCGRTSKTGVLHGFLTKDEEDVAEALYELARMGNGNPEDQLDTKAASTSYAEGASKEEDAKLLLPCAANEVANLSACLEEPSERTEMVEPPSLEQSAILSQSLLIVEQNPKGEQKENLSSGNTMCFPNLLGSSANCSDNGEMKQKKSDLPQHRADIVLFGSTGSDVVHEEQQARQTSENEAALHVRRGLPSTSHGHSAMSSPNKVTVCPDSDTCVAKLSLINSGTTSCRKKCATHVYLSHLIQMHQSKSREGSKPVFPATCETAGMRDGFNCTSSATSSGTFMKRKGDDARSHMLHNATYLPVQQSSTIHEAHVEQRMGMAYDFLSFSAGQGATNNSGNRGESSGHPHSPFLHQHSPHHPNVPFPFSRVPYTHPYPENLVSPASQQLRVPQYMGNPYYRPHMNLPGGSTKLQLQQQLWQSYLAQHSPPIGYDSPSLWMSAQASLPIPPGTGGHYHSSNTKRQQLLPDVPTSSSSAAKHQQDRYKHSGVYDTVAFHQDGSSQLQLLCNAQRS
ncbi:uncharacterized protein [Typha latifolia]|uniref:uncharacterized protein isoform X1 n=2 Tax=Typha latifolia TaxID=4733 RepID=UPI003C2EA704